MASTAIVITGAFYPARARQAKEGNEEVLEGDIE
jgi:hypothetical protein